ncbi:MAG: HNH endonuclease [Proteobacteria bacterium]|nr:HNH endonuclease [Pseudomonadota bacterium]
MEDKPQLFFSKVEHVIPQSFGVFRNNFTLVHMVCDDCNQYFGDNLDIALARDSFEGGLRFLHKVKDPKKFRSSGKKSRLIIKVDQGEMKGTYVYREFSKDQGRILIKPLPQVGFLKKASDIRNYFLLKDIPDKTFLEENGYDLTTSDAIRIFAEDYDSAMQLLSSKGIKFRTNGVFEPKGTPELSWMCKVEGVIDTTILRTAAKIAFNYLAYWNNTAFMLHPSFDITRRFIRGGEKPDYPIAGVSPKTILGSEPEERKRAVGHIITVNWAADKESIVAQVSLFNCFSYVVCLAKEFKGEHRNIRKGHFFSPHNQMIFELGAKER